MEIKYEAVFGPQELFEGMMDDCELVCGEYGYKVKVSDLFYCEKYNQRYGWSKSTKSVLQLHPVTAMRRIIRTPTWTVADQKAGRLPDVGAFYDAEGCRVKHLGVGAAGYEDIFHFEYPSGACGCSNKIFIKPIETPEEMEARLRSEWCNRAMDYSTIQQLYDAMLSGELAVPVAPEQNK